MAHLAGVTGGPGRFDLALILLNVVVDGVHAGAGQHGPEQIGPNIRLLPGRLGSFCACAHPTAAGTGCCV